jgi:hypothetical protein
MEMSGLHHTHATLHLQRNLFTRRLGGPQSQSGPFGAGQPLVKPVRSSMKVGREELKWQNGSEIFKIPCFAKHLTLIIIFPWCVFVQLPGKGLYVCVTYCQLPEEFSSIWI